MFSGLDMEVPIYRPIPIYRYLHQFQQVSVIFMVSGIGMGKQDAEGIQNPRKKTLGLKKKLPNYNLEL